MAIYLYLSTRNAVFDRKRIATHMNNERPMSHSIALACLVVILFFAWTLYWSVNIPNADDFELFLRFVNQLSSEESYFGLAKSLFAPHNEHRVVTSRLAALVWYSIFGVVDFRALIAWGNFAIVVIALVFMASFAKLSAATHPTELVSRLAVFPILIFLCQPSYLEATEWASTAIPSLWVMGFGLLSCCSFFSREEASRIIACGSALVCALLSALSLGNGVLVFLALSVTCALQKRFTGAVFWFCGFLLGFYLLSLDALADHSSEFELSFQKGEAFLTYVVLLVGAAFGFGKFWYSLISGMVICGLFLWLCARRAYTSSPALFAFLLFVFLSIGANALGRAPLGIRFAYTTSRYTFLSVLVACACYFLIYGITKRKKEVCIGGYLLAILFSILSWLHDGAYYRGRQELLQDSLLRFGIFGKGLAHPIDESAQNILKDALAKGLYESPRFNLGTQLREPQEGALMPTSETKFLRKIEHLYQDEKYLLIDGWGFLKDQGNQGGQLRIILINQTRAFYLTPQRRIRPDLVNHFRRDDISQSGFFLLTKLANLPEGSYELFLQTEINGQLFKKSAHRTIVVTSPSAS